jgi:hypothetical protein
MPTRLIPQTCQRQERPITVTVKPIEECVRIGQEAWSRLTSCQVWDDWLLVGEALAAGHDKLRDAR